MEETTINDNSAHNSPELSVSELSNALKRTLEGAFEHVRVRGEISGCKIASSGHIYFDLKDDKSLINAVCWKGVGAKLPAAPENGMEVICTGRISTYAGRSNYQLIIERIELSGAGALAAMLERRKQQFAAEGLFAIERKRTLPYLPLTIGVVTSPTGAVIRDILHRLEERFPVRVLVWGVAVQGKGAELQIAAAINGFNELTHHNLNLPTSLPTPDLLTPDLIIVARGGGSMEDLWCFNDELVVRAAANSVIPIISAIGHETDFTLLDFVADKRAPTPTAAAEMAVPVLQDLRFTLQQHAHHMQQQILRKLDNQQERLNAMARGLINPQRALEMKMQRLDEWQERLNVAINQLLQQTNQAMERAVQRLNLRNYMQQIEGQMVNVQNINQRMEQAMQSHLRQHDLRLSGFVRMLKSLNHNAMLLRGYAYLSNPITGEVLSNIGQLNKVNEVKVHLQDGEMLLYKNKSTKKPSPSNQLDLF